MKKLIEFTKNWKHRNLLHVVGGFLMANYWEFCQKKDFGAKYSISDILLTTLGGVLGSVLVMLLIQKN